MYDAEKFYFVSMRHQKPGGLYPPSVIVPEDAEVVRLGLFLSHGVRSAGFNGAIESASGSDADLNTTEWRGLADASYTFEVIRFRRGGPEATDEEINAPGPRYGATYENGWEATGQTVIGKITIAPPKFGDKEWDEKAWVISRPNSGAGSWVQEGGGHRDAVWVSATGSPQVQRGDCVKFIRTIPSGYPHDIFDNISGNPVNNDPEYDFFPFNRLPLNYHNSQASPDPLTQYVSSPTGIQLKSADDDHPVHGEVLNVPSVMNQWRKAREGGVSVVFAREE